MAKRLSVVSEWAGQGRWGSWCSMSPFGHTLAINGEREPKCFSAWTSYMDALKALNVRSQPIQGGQTARALDLMLGPRRSHA